MSPSAPFALLDDCHATAANPRSRLYTGFVRTHRCVDPARLEALWAAVEQDLRAGLHALVLADYEWGERLQQLPDLAPRAAAPDGGAECGSLRVLMFDALQLMSAAQVEDWLAARERALAGGAAGAVGDTPGPANVLDPRSDVDDSAFAQAIARIHAAIAAGETYQVNFSYRIDFDLFGAPESLYRRLRAAQPVAFGAFIRLPSDAPGPAYVLSCSPELFVAKTGALLRARPMKGTAARVGEAVADAATARALAADPKNRAENLMIVDLLRNDLGRIACTGSVRVPALFAVEHYPTVCQMTSTVEAALRPGVGFAAVLRALFPCGSITGAPKHRTMSLIRVLETTPRGLYTGAIGWVDAPRAGESCGDFCLSVAIRTVTLKPAPAAGLWRGRLGVGAGIVIDSDAAAERAECALKARFMTTLEPGFTLFETLFATREGGVRHLDRHLARLGASAAALQFAFPRERIVAALAAALARLPSPAPVRVRLDLHKSGRFDTAVAPLEALPPGPVKVLLGGPPHGLHAALLAHKTSLRSGYDEGIRRALACGAFDTLFCNRAGEITEGGRTNVFVRLGGQWLTPPLAGEVLPGVMRGVLMDDPAWAVREARVSQADVLAAERVVLTNALRGVLEADVVAPG